MAQTDLEQKLNSILLEKQEVLSPDVLKKDVTFLGITGTYEGSGGGSSEPSVEQYLPEKPIKLYSNIEELQADTDVIRDTVGLVYDYNGTPLDVGSEFQYILFPETVVLPEPVTEVYKKRVHLEDNIVVTDGTEAYISECSLYKSEFCFSLHVSDAYILDIEATYNSDDGITYTRGALTYFGNQDENGLCDLHHPFKIINSWDKRFNYFMSPVSSELISVYHAKGDNNLDLPLTSEVKIENGGIVIRRKSYNNFIDRSKLISLISKIEADLKSTLDTNCGCIFKHQGKWVYGFVTYNTGSGKDMTYNLENNVLEDGTIDTTTLSSCILNDTVTFTGIRLYELDFDEQTYTTIDTSGYITETKTTTYTRDNGTTYTRKFLFTDIPTDTMTLSVSIYASLNIPTIKPSTLKTVDAVTSYTPSIIAYQSGKGTYELAPTQLTLTDANKLAKGEIAYGNGQVIEGTFESATTKYAPRRISFNSYHGTELDAEIAALDTSNITTFGGMFTNCDGLISLDLTGFNTDNVTDMTSMFISCIALTSVNMSTFNTSNVTSTKYMFKNCTSLQTIDISGFDFSNVTDGTGMFSSVPTNCTIYVKDQDTVTLLTSWDSTHTYTIKS